jgi:hypothetical protein
MAFCTSCGANVSGAFCNQCGTPVRAQGTTAPSQGMTPPPPIAQPAPGMAAPPLVVAPRKTSPIVWILVIVLGLFVLGIVGVVGTGFFVLHKAKQAGFDTALMSRNPGLAVAKMITAMNPDAEVVKTDDSAGTITIRDRSSGKVMNFTFDDIRNGKFNMKVKGDDGDGSIQIGGGDGKLPDWVPAYPGSTGQGTFSVKGSSSDGGEGGNYTFTTPDPPAKVMTFYQDKARDIGLKANLTTNTPDGGMLIVADEGSNRTLTIVVGKGSPDTTVNLTYAMKK